MSGRRSARAVAFILALTFLASALPPLLGARRAARAAPRSAQPVSGPGPQAASPLGSQAASPPGSQAGTPLGSQAASPPGPQAASWLSQGVQASGVVTLGGGTCFPDAVLLDCSGTVVEQLKGPGGAGFFVSYIGRWVDLTGARQTCPAGDTYLDVVTIQSATNQCNTPTPGGPTATPGGPTATASPTATATVAPTATPGGPTPTPGQIFDVAMRDNYFDPTSINIPVGSVVRWTNLGANSHTSTSDSGLWDSGTLNPGASFLYAFNTAGTYAYHDVFHRPLGMTGTVIVGGAAQATATPDASGNLARGKAVQASSTQAGQAPELAVDGDGATFWASLPGYDPYAPARNVQWIYVDLGSSFAVQKMHMVWGHWRHARGYSIYAWMSYCNGWCLIASTRNGDGDDTAVFPEAVEARHWMLWLVNPYLIGGHYELTEWEIEGSSSTPAAADNVAAGKPAVALNHLPGFEAPKASDADLATEWRTVRLPAWIYVDLMAAEEVDRVVLRWSPGLHATEYTLYAWNGIFWAPIYGKTGGAGGDETLVFPHVRTRYVLLYTAAGPANNVGLRELEVYRRRTGGMPRPLLEGDWRSLRGAGRPELVPDDVVPDAARAPNAPVAAPQEGRTEQLLRVGPDRSSLPVPRGP